MQFARRKHGAARDDPYSHIARGSKLEADTGRLGVVDDGNIAWPERIAEASRQWTQARAGDFERRGKRTYVDLGTGREYRRVSGCPLLSIGGEANRGISTFFVGPGNTLVRPGHRPQARHAGRARRHPTHAMSRRLLQTKGGKGLYLDTDPAVGSWTEWLPLLPSDVDPAAKLLTEQAAPSPGWAGGLYAVGEQQQRDEARRAADRALEEAGVKPRRTW